jgi:ribosomal protein S27AE
MTPGIKAIRKLANMGYRFQVNGAIIRACYEGHGDPDSDQVCPLLDLIRAHKEEVLYFLKCHCPRCGSVVFVGDLCFLCDWIPQARSQDKDTEKGQGAFSCGKCGHFLPSRLNPSQGFGRCALERFSKRPGAYPDRTACPHFEVAVGEDTLRLAQ